MALLHFLSVSMKSCAIRDFMLFDYCRITSSLQKSIVCEMLRIGRKIKPKWPKQNKRNYWFEWLSIACKTSCFSCLSTWIPLAGNSKDFYWNCLVKKDWKLKNPFLTVVNFKFQYGLWIVSTHFSWIIVFVRHGLCGRQVFTWDLNWFMLKSLP